MFDPASFPPAGFRDSLRAPSPSDLPLPSSLPNTPAEELRALGLGGKFIPRNPFFDPLSFSFPSCLSLLFLRLGTEGDFLIFMMCKGRGVTWMSFLVSYDRPSTSRGYRVRTTDVQGCVNHWEGGGGDEGERPRA